VHLATINVMSSVCSWKSDRLAGMTNRLRVEALVTLLLAGSPPTVAYADTTIKTRTVITDSGAPGNVQNPSEHRDVRYRKGTMRRKDSFGDGATTLFSQIANCDSRTGFLIDAMAREYRTYKVVRFLPSSELDGYRKKNPRDAIEIQSTTVETGERKTFFGFPARHFITTTRRIAQNGEQGGEETMDAWYIDHETPDNNCAPDYAHTDPFYAIGTALVVLPQVAHFNHTGPVPTGLAVQRTVTHKTSDSSSTTARIVRIEETVEELSDAPLSLSLFELPPGLRENPDLLGGRSVPRLVPRE
jgi:hypothetical protein